MSNNVAFEILRNFPIKNSFKVFFVQTLETPSKETNGHRSLIFLIHAFIGFILVRITIDVISESPVNKI